MREIYADAGATSCHEHWRELMTHRLKFDHWSVLDGLLLLADLWPVGIEIKESEVMHPQYGALEPPIVNEAKLLNQECNIKQYANYERLRIMASRRFGQIRELWDSARHTEEFYSPTFFVQWAEAKGIVPCWIDLHERPEIEAASKANSRSNLLPSRQYSSDSPRRDAIAAAINKAMSNAVDPTSNASVWEALKLLAIDETSPFIGLVNDVGLHYTDTNEQEQVLTKSKFQNRMTRLRKKM